MPKENIIDITFIIICAVLWGLIYFPILVYHLINYCKRGTNIVYLLRYCNITVIQSILFILKLLYGIFTAASSVYIFGHNTTADFIIRAVNAYLAAFFLYCFVWKFWLLRYNIMLNNIVMNSEWKSIINPNKYVANKTFYAKYKGTFGNTTFTMYICLFMAIVFTTMFVLTHIVYPEFYGNSQDTNPYLIQLYAGWDYILPFILLIIIYIKTPKFEDNFYITKEMKYIFICLCVQYTVYYAYLFLMWMLTTPNPVNDITEDTLFIIEFQIIVAAQFMAIMFSTAWVNNRCNHIIEDHRYEIHKISSKLRLNIEQKHCIEIQPKPVKDDDCGGVNVRNDTFDSSTKGSSGREFLDDHSNGGQSYRDGIFDILSNSATYNEFMKHLSKEFSVECLLSLTEFIQFRDYIKSQIDDTVHDYNDDMDDDDDDDDDGIQCHRRKSRKNGSESYEELMIKLPSDIPYSYIVENKEWNNKEKAYRLYTKYIENGSELEINISAEQRMYYDHLMEDYDIFMNNQQVTNRELIDLFIPCCTQMIYLMIDSRKRFEETAIFNKLQRHKS